VTSIMRRCARAVWRTKVRRYNWHSARSLGWPFPVLKYKYIFQIKYTEAILSNSTRKLLWFEISKMLIKFIVLFIINFGPLSFPICCCVSVRICCLFVRHMPILYQNDWTDRACFFSHGSVHPTFLHYML